MIGGGVAGGDIDGKMVEPRPKELIVTSRCGSKTWEKKLRRLRPRNARKWGLN